MFNDHEHFTRAMLDQRRREQEQELRQALWRRQAREQVAGDTDVVAAGLPSRGRVALGTLLVKLGAALIGCEAHARAALERPRISEVS